MGGLTADGVSDSFAGELFGVAIDHAERANDFRLSSGHALVTGELQEHYRLCARSMAGFAITNTESDGLPLSFRLEDALEYGGFCVRAAEIEVLGDMVEWLDERTEITGLWLPSGARASRVRTAVMPVLRLEQEHFAITDQVDSVYGVRPA